MAAHSIALGCGCVHFSSASPVQQGLPRSALRIPPSAFSAGPSPAGRRSAHGRPFVVRAEVGVSIGGARGEAKAKSGDKIKVTQTVKVYHVPKNREFDLNGAEGVVKDILGMWKGVEVSANLPYKVQFDLEIDGVPAKFFAHLKEDEFEVL